MRGGVNGGATGCGERSADRLDRVAPRAFLAHLLAWELEAEDGSPGDDEVRAGAPVCRRFFGGEGRSALTEPFRDRTRNGRLFPQMDS